MILVEILGITGYDKTDILKANLLKALQELGLELPVSEITDVDVLTKSSISAIPALRVNGEIVIQKDVPEVEDLKILLNALLKSENTEEEESSQNLSD